MAVDAGERRKILFVSHTPAGGPFVVGSHHLARGFARLGHQVVHLSPPVTPAHLLILGRPFERERMARWWRGGRLIDGVTDLVPAGTWPWAAVRRGPDAARRFGLGYAASARRLLAAHAMLEPDLVLLDEPRLAHVLELIKARRLVYRPTDLYAKMRGDPSIADIEVELVARADTLIATAEPVAAHLRALGGRSVRVLENGVDLDHFGPSATGACPPLPAGPCAVYTGALDERFGLESLRLAAERLPEVAFVLAGPPGASIRTVAAALPNIHLLGPVPYAALPALLARCHVALLPMSAHPANEGRSPMKLYEYAASGLSVVATATAELRRRAPDFVRLASSDEAFADHVRTAIAERRGSLGDPLAAARVQGWEAKCQQVLTWSSCTSAVSA